MFKKSQKTLRTPLEEAIFLKNQFINLNRQLDLLTPKLSSEPENEDLAAQKAKLEVQLKKCEKNLAENTKLLESSGNPADLNALELIGNILDSNKLNDNEKQFLCHTTMMRAQVSNLDNTLLSNPKFAAYVGKIKSMDSRYSGVDLSQNGIYKGLKLVANAPVEAVKGVLNGGRSAFAKFTGNAIAPEDKDTDPALIKSISHLHDAVIRTHNAFNNNTWATKDTYSNNIEKALNFATKNGGSPELTNTLELLIAVVNATHPTNKNLFAKVSELSKQLINEHNPDLTKLQEIATTTLKDFAIQRELAPNLSQPDLKTPDLQKVVLEGLARIRKNNAIDELLKEIQPIKAPVVAKFMDSFSYHYQEEELTALGADGGDNTDMNS